MATKIDRQDLEKILIENLPASHHASVAKLADVLSRAVNDESSSVQTNILAAELHPLLEALAGKQIGNQRTLISFGQGSDLGNVKIDDVAGNNINKLYFENVESGGTSIRINFYGQAVGQDSSAGIARKPRIYISHYATEPAAREFLEKLRTTLSNSFHVLPDGDRLANKPWQNSLYAWMGLAHAGIILLSSDSLDSTEWQVPEANVLSGRQLLDQEFILLYVLPDGSVTEQLRDRIVGGSKLPSNAKLLTGTPDQVLAKIDTALERLRQPRFAEAPLEKLGRMIARLVSESHPQALWNTVQLLKMDIDPHVTDDELRILMAGVLWSADVNHWAKALNEIAHGNAAEHKALADWIVPAWIDPCSARMLLDSAVFDSGALVLVVTGHEIPFVVKSLVRRAFYKPPDHHIPIVFAGKFSDGASPQVYIQGIRSLLAQEVLGEETSEGLDYFEQDLRDELRKNPIILVIPAIPDQTTLNLLQSAFPFPRLTILLMHDPTQEKTPPQLPDTPILSPAYKGIQERTAHREYRRLSSFVPN